MTNYQIVPTRVDSPSVAQEKAADETEDETASSALQKNGKNENLQNPPQIKVYRRRWAMLLIFVLVSTSNAFQWIQFSIITSIIMRYKLLIVLFLVLNGHSLIHFLFI